MTNLIEVAWNQLETIRPIMTSELLREGSLKTWVMYYNEQEWEYNATILMLFLVMNGENIS